MQISRTLWEAFQDLLAADTATLAAATAMKVHLVIASFVPALDLETIGDLTLATFTGSTAKSAGIGTAQTFYDVANGLRSVQVLEPAGGWHWTCTADPASPETVYGWVLTDTAGTTIWGSALLDSPVTISAAGQGLDIDQVRMEFSEQSPQ